MHGTRTLVHRTTLCLCLCLGSSLVGAGCATTVNGHERALFYSTRSGLAREPVPSGLYWHWPWNEYIRYDLRWTLRKEKIDVTSRDGLHLNIDVAVDRPAGINAISTPSRPSLDRSTTKTSSGRRCSAACGPRRPGTATSRW